MFDGYSLIVGLLAIAVLTILLALAPLGCWNCLIKLLKIQKDVRDEMRLLNAAVRGRQNCKQVKRDVDLTIPPARR
jgi:hypothetical protein